VPERQSRWIGWHISCRGKQFMHLFNALSHEGAGGNLTFAKL